MSSACDEMEGGRDWPYDLLPIRAVLSSSYIQARTSHRPGQGRAAMLVECMKRALLCHVTLNLPISLGKKKLESGVGDVMAGPPRAAGRSKAGSDLSCSAAFSRPREPRDEHAYLLWSRLSCLVSLVDRGDTAEGTHGAGHATSRSGRQNFGVRWSSNSDNLRNLSG